jgi:hypothetical protein
MDKIYYDGDGYKILNNPLIIKLISEHKIEFRDNKLFVDTMVFRGTQRFSAPIYTLPGMKCFRKAFDGVFIYEKDNVPYIDYDVKAVEEFVGRVGINMEKVATDFRHGAIINYKYKEGED